MREEQHTGDMLPERRIPHASCRCLETLPTPAIDAHLDDAQRHAARAAKLATESGPRARVRAQTMIDVERFERKLAPVAQPREAIEQNDGVNTAAQRGRDVRTGVKKWFEMDVDVGREFSDAVTGTRLP
jgi:hypothetical protein